MNKKDIYKQYGIEYKSGKVLSPLFGFINPLLVNGNSKLGEGVYTFSTLAGTGFYPVPDNYERITEIKGTCVCDCSGCYAKTGFYNMPSVIRSNAIKTVLARYYMEFVKNAIIAQIKADNIQFVRIHASGDFFSADYINMWAEIASACESCVFWSYTKNKQAENAFDSINNVNIVRSCVPGIGFNFGHCDYVMNTYKALKQAEKSVYICRCGVDSNQHCNNCKGCSKNEYVLFIEHSTNYKAAEDPHFSELAALIESQAEQ